MEKDTTLRHRFAFCKMVPHHKQKQVSQWKPALPYVRDCVPVRKKAERLLPQLVCHVCELPPKLVPQKGSAPNLLAAGCRGKYPQMPAAEGQVVVGMENQGRLCWHDHHAEHFYVEHCLPLNSPRKIPCRAPQSQKGSPGMVAFFKVSDCLKKRFLLQVGCVQTQCWYWLWPLVPLHGVVLDMWLQVQDPKASPKCSFVMASTHQAFPSTQVEQYWTPKRHCFSLLPSKPVVCGDFCLVPHTQGFFGAGWHIFFSETKFFIIWWLFTGSCRAEYPPGKPLDLETTKDHCVFAIWKIWMKVYGINWGRMTPSLWHRKPL